MKKLAEKYIQDLNIPEMKIKEIENTSDFYCFSYYHPTEIHIGQSLIFINKPDERFFIYSSAKDDPKTDFLEKIKREKIARVTFPEFDIRKSYTIKVNRVLRKMNLIEKLLTLDFNYVVPEVVGSDIFRIPQSYNQKLFEKRLSKLPCEFNNINGEKVWHILSLNQEKKVVEFTITEFVDINKENRIERATEIDMETVW